VPDGDLLVQDACAPTDDELAAAERDEFIQQGSCQGRTDAGMKHCEPRSVGVDLMQGVRPQFRTTLLDEARTPLFDETADHLLEETQHAVFRHIYGFD
jgi:hypothetical protein